MKLYRVVLTRRAEEQLNQIETYIASQASREIARRFVNGIVEKCNALEYFPMQGTPRPEVGAGVRTGPFRRRTTILYAVDEDAVVVFGVFYGGQDWQSQVAGQGGGG